MKKLLIAIVNARHRSEWRSAIRTTWMPLVPRDKADVFFFVGRGEPVEDTQDVIELNCHDEYMGLPEKVRAIARWSHERNYEFTMKCDDDVVLKPAELLASGFDEHNYTGPGNRMPTALVPCWVPMGFNYILSKAALSHLLEEPLPTEGNDDEKWVALTLHKNGIDLHSDPRYKLQYGTLYERPLRPPIRAIRRPLSTHPDRGCFPGTFSWCIFMEGNSGNRISTDRKVAEFMKVFTEQVSVNSTAANR